MYDVRVCVAAKVRMIPTPILYCHFRGVLGKMGYQIR